MTIIRGFNLTKVIIRNLMRVCNLQQKRGNLEDKAGEIEAMQEKAGERIDDLILYGNRRKEKEIISLSLTTSG